jgi:hypothetical protein
VWNLAHSAAVTTSRSLSLALRRLGLATQRTIPEDRILDVFIAAEAFYLAEADDDSRGRTRIIIARLAGRATAWSHGTLPGWDGRQVRLQMKRGYNVRSVVAHGTEPRPGELKSGMRKSA